MLNYNFVNQKAKESLIDKITIEREYWQLLILQRLYTYLESEKFFFKIKGFDPQELKKDLNQFLPENYRNFYQSLPKETLKLLKEQKT